MTLFYSSIRHLALLNLKDAIAEKTRLERLSQLIQPASGQYPSPLSLDFIRLVTALDLD